MADSPHVKGVLIMGSPFNPSPVGMRMQVSNLGPGYGRRALNMYLARKALVRTAAKERKRVAIGQVKTKEQLNPAKPSGEACT
jgi:hypothetical protein